MNWPMPTCVAEVRSFLGLATYFRKFMQGFAELAHPLHELFKKNVSWCWGPKQQTAFERIKTSLVTAPVLIVPDLGESAAPFTVITDASLFAIGAVLMQNDRPVAFESRKLIPAECNYPVTDLELLAVIHALTKWRCYLEGPRFRILTDHKPLTHLNTQKTVNRRQARWLETLQRYDCSIDYLPGSRNPADGLSRIVWPGASGASTLGERIPLP